VSALARQVRAGVRRQPAPDVQIVVPVYNERVALERSIHRLHRFLTETFPFSWRIVIVDNASTDGTFALARGLTRELEGVEAVHLDAKGRGRALHAAWLQSDAEVLCYMDVDLSTDLRGLLPLVAPLMSGHSDLAIGTRLHRGAKVSRSRRREVISRAYNRLLRLRFSDAQCGFKAIRAGVARKLVPDVRDQEWFFDTELLVLAQRRGLRIHEVPVDWVEDKDSRVAIVPTALADLRGVLRLCAAEPVARFALIGVASTLAYAGLYATLRAPLHAGIANVLALALTAIANTAANRHFTFGVHGRAGLARHHAQALVVFALTVAITSAALLALRGLDPDAPAVLEVVVLAVASTIATIARYLGLRHWVFSARRTTS
jgi:glycosyltransferase involved in cell wall biosynthesis